jgi:hypothetical protein
LPSWASVTLLTIARPRPTPGWSLRMRSVASRPVAARCHGSQGGAAKLRWRKWTGTQAVGTGALWVPDNCDPNYPENRYPVTLTLSDVKTLRVRELSSAGEVSTRTIPAFTAIRVHFTGPVPPRWARSRTYHLIRTHGTDYYYSFARGW